MSNGGSYHKPVRPRVFAAGPRQTPALPPAAVEPVRPIKTPSARTWLIVVGAVSLAVLSLGGLIIVARHTRPPFIASIVSVDWTPPQSGGTAQPDGSTVYSFGWGAKLTYEVHNNSKNTALRLTCYPSLLMGTMQWRGDFMYGQSITVPAGGTTDQVVDVTPPNFGGDTGTQPQATGQISCTQP